MNVTKDTEITQPSLTPSTLAAINEGNKSNYSLRGQCSEATGTINLALTDESNSVIEPAIDPSCGSDHTWSESLDVSSLADGNISVTLSFTDPAGNTSDVLSKTVVKDTVLPSVTIASTFRDFFSHTDDGENAYVIEGTCSEHNQSVTIQMYETSSPLNVVTPLGGDPLCEESGGQGSWTARLNPHALSDGGITIEVSQRDGAGNEQQASATATKDTQAPTLSITPPPAINGSTVMATYAVSGACSEEGREITVTLEDAGGQEIVPNSVPSCTNSSAWMAVFDVSSLQDGALSVNALHRDVAGNEASAMDSMEKDIQNPIVLIDNLNNIYATIAAAYSLSGTCSEEGVIVTLATSQVMELQGPE